MVQAIVDVRQHPALQQDITLLGLTAKHRGAKHITNFVAANKSRHRLDLHLPVLLKPDSAPTEDLARRSHTKFDITL
jgi:hypothetical protein